MNFKRRTDYEPEINLIPFIDVLLVILIFLMLSTTYGRLTELKIILPSANAEAQQHYAKELVVSVGRNGDYAINDKRIASRAIAALVLALTEAAGDNKDAVVIVHADAMASHQSVITVLDAARQGGFAKVTFASKSDNAATAAP